MHDDCFLEEQLGHGLCKFNDKTGARTESKCRATLAGEEAPQFHVNLHQKKTYTPRAR